MFCTVLLPQLDTVDEQWESVAQHVLDCNYTLSNAEKLDTFRKVREFYFGNERVSFANVDKFIKVMYVTCIQKIVFMR